MDKILVYAKGSFRKVVEDTVYHLDDNDTLMILLIHIVLFMSQRLN